MSDLLRSMRVPCEKCGELVHTPMMEVHLLAHCRIMQEELVYWLTEDLTDEGLEELLAQG